MTFKTIEVVNPMSEADFERLRSLEERGALATDRSYPPGEKTEPESTSLGALEDRLDELTETVRALMTRNEHEPTQES